MATTIITLTNFSMPQSHFHDLPGPIPDWIMEQKHGCSLYRFVHVDPLGYESWMIQILGLSFPPRSKYHLSQR